MGEAEIDMFSISCSFLQNLCFFFLTAAFFIHKGYTLRVSSQLHATAYVLVLSFSF